MQVDWTVVSCRTKITHCLSKLIYMAIWKPDGGISNRYWTTGPTADRKTHGCRGGNSAQNNNQTDGPKIKVEPVYEHTPDRKHREMLDDSS